MRLLTPLSGGILDAQLLDLKSVEQCVCPVAVDLAEVHKPWEAAQTQSPPQGCVTFVPNVLVEPVFSPLPGDAQKRSRHVFLPEVDESGSEGLGELCDAPDIRGYIPQRGVRLEKVRDADVEKQTVENNDDLFRHAPVNESSPSRQPSVDQFLCRARAPIAVLRHTDGMRLLALPPVAVGNIDVLQSESDRGGCS